MNKTLIFGIGIFILLLTSCKTETKKYVEIENPTVFKNGEWISNKDSLSGISIRKGVLAFFKNMEFVADSIYDYKIVDSISIIGNQKVRIGTYIKRTNLSDTLYSEIKELTDSTLTLKKNKVIEIYNLK
jgi:hypothetical protein